MKLIISIPDKIYKKLLENKGTDKSLDFDDSLILEVVAEGGIPLEEELKAIKEDMKETFYDYKNNRYDVSMEGVIDVLDKRIEENKNNDSNVWGK